MCGRFDFHGDTKDIVALIDVVGEVDASTHHYNLAPTQMAMAALIDDPNVALRPRLTSMHFGMPLFGRPGLVLNARAESAAEKPMFREALRHRRCLIFANGFYEWTKVGARKQPYYFTLQDSPVFAFAGLYSRAQDGETHFVILTTQANACVQPLHHRMPVILPPEALAPWLAPDTAAQDAQKWLTPLTDIPMQVHPVTAQMGSPKFTNAACIAPITL